MGALVDYLDLTQRGKLPLLRPPVREAAGGAMQIDAATRRNLETDAGAVGRPRRLAAGGDRPHRHRRRARGCWSGGCPARRCDLARDPRPAGRGAAFCWTDAALRDDLREALRRVPDIDRALSRLALDRGGPRDLTAIRAGLAQAERDGRACWPTRRRCWPRRPRR